MKTSQSISKISGALLSAQKKIGAASKESVNPFFKSKYADLGAVMECCKQALNESGISVLQPVVIENNIACVETTLLHESGEFITGCQPIVCKQEHDPQAQGSAITYARRYSLQSMLFIPAEDDDGNKATNGNSQHQQKQPAPTKQPAKSAQPPTPEIFEMHGVIDSVEVKGSDNAKVFVYTLNNGGKCGTYSETQHSEWCRYINCEVKFYCVKSKNGNYIIDKFEHISGDPLPF